MGSGSPPPCRAGWAAVRVGNPCLRQSPDGNRGHRDVPWIHGGPAIQGPVLSGVGPAALKIDWGVGVFRLDLLGRPRVLHPAVRGLAGHLKNITLGWSNKNFVQEVTGVGHLLILISFAPCVVLVWLTLRPDQAKSPIMLIAIFASLLTAFLANGRRSAVVLPAIMLYIGYSLARRRVNFVALFTIGAVLFLSICALGACSGGPKTRGAGQLDSCSPWRANRSQRSPTCPTQS